MSARRKRSENKPMVFSSLNYKMVGVGVLLVIFGFTIMRIENEVYGFISLYVAPVLVMAGYITIVFAILKKPHDSENGNPHTVSQNR